MNLVGIIVGETSQKAVLNRVDSITDDMSLCSLSEKRVTPAVIGVRSQDMPSKTGFGFLSEEGSDVGKVVDSSPHKLITSYRAMRIGEQIPFVSQEVADACYKLALSAHDKSFPYEVARVFQNVLSPRDIRHILSKKLPDLSNAISVMRDMDATPCGHELYREAKRGSLPVTSEVKEVIEDLAKRALYHQPLTDSLERTYEQLTSNSFFRRLLGSIKPQDEVHNYVTGAGNFLEIDFLDVKGSFNKVLALYARMKDSPDNYESESRYDLENTFRQIGEANESFLMSVGNLQDAYKNYNLSEAFVSFKRNISLLGASINLAASCFEELARENYLLDNGDKSSNYSEFALSSRMLVQKLNHGIMKHMPKMYQLDDL